MSSETDHPRQRTVAELLAEHGASGTSGRRRRRREETEHDESAFVNGGVPPEASDWPPERSVLRDPVPPPAPPPFPRAEVPPPSGAGRSRRFEQRGAPESSGPPRPQVTPAGRGEVPRDVDGPPDVESTRSIDVKRGIDVKRSIDGKRGIDVKRGSDIPRRDRHRDEPLPAAESPPLRSSAPAARPRVEPEPFTEQMPQVRRDSTAMLDPLLTAPLQHQKPVDDGASTVVGLAPADVEGRPRERSAVRRRAEVGRPAGRSTARPADDDGGPSTQASAAPFDLDDGHPAGLGTDGLHDGETDLDEVGTARVRPARSPGQAWAGVVAQWILGAVGGAALWVGFRYLWQELTVVAIAAAVLVTIGLVLVVRHLLRNDDRRTTVFAVLVGLLLTVSPALLVLLHRT